MPNAHSHPRAGHGPGIAGFKADSEISMALNGGHPCYFVGFLPNPMPGQTIEDVTAAEALVLLLIDEDRAVEAIAAMLPAGRAERDRAFAAVRQIVDADGVDTPAKRERLARIEALFRPHPDGAPQAA